MPKRRRGSDSDATTTRTAGYNTVFVDTNLDTSIAMLVFESDTVSDFKKKLVGEHKQCYPEMAIRIHSLKVKHRSRFYRLSDNMLVWSAFHGVQRSWHLSVDASETPSNTNSSELGLVVSAKTMDAGDVCNNCGVLSSDINKIHTLPMPSPDCAAKNDEVLDMIPYIEFGNSLDDKTDIQKCKETESPAKKKRKMRHTRDVCHDLGSKESDPPSHASSKDTVIPDTLVCGISTADAMKKGTGTADVSVVRNDGSVLEGRVASEGTSVLGIEKQGNLGSTVDCQNPTDSDERKNGIVLESTTIAENLTASQNKYEPGLDIQADHSGVVYVKVPDISAGSTLSKRKRKKALETAVNIHYATDVEQTPTGKSIKPCPDIHKSEEKEEERHLSLSRDTEVEMPSSYKAGLTNKKASKITSKKKNKIEKMSSNTNLEKSGTEKTDHDFSGGPSGLVMHHVQTDKVESTMDCKNSIGSEEKKNDTFLESIIIPENLLASKEFEPGLDIQDDNSGADSVKAPYINAGLMDSNGTIENINSTFIKRKRKKTQETAVNIQDATEAEHTPQGDIHKSEGKEVEKQLSLNSYHEVDIQSRNKASDHTNPGLKHKEESKIMIPTKKKKIKKKSANTNLEKSGTEQTDNDISGGPSGLLFLSTRHLPLETGKEENILFPGGEDVQLKLLNGSTLDVVHVGEKVPDADGKEADFVMSSQTKLTLEAVSSGKRETDKETQNSPGNGHADIPVVEKENQIVEFHQLEKDTENTVNTGKSAKKKRKNKTLTTSDVQEDLSVKNRNVGIGSSTEIVVYTLDAVLNGSTLDVVHVGEKVPDADGKEADFVMSSQTKQTLEAVSSGKRETDKETQNSPGNGHADIPVVEKENQIVEFHKLEKDTENTVNTGKSAKKKRKNKTLATSDVQEDLSVKNRNVGIGSSTEIVVYTNDQARTNENEGEGVNFKRYFVPDHYQDKSGSDGKAKKPNQSDVKTLKKLKKNGSSSVSISTEVQSSSKLSTDGERNNKSCVRKDSGNREGDSAQNSDWDEVIPNSSRRSSRAPKKFVKDSNTSEIPGTLFKKPEEILAGSSLPKKKNASLKKSSSERIEKFPEMSGNKMPHFGVNVINRMELKTPEKKSLLTKLGSLFEDNSGESSGDENGTGHSSDSTESPSDSSSTSDHSVGESDLSLDSSRNGSSDARVRSTGGKGTSKLDLSAMKDVTMKMILQSSDRFKKAKLLASQNEAYQNIDTQPIEFVPESQPS